jgi:hypothetical protein
MENPNEEDDVSLGSSEYSKISQSELNDIAIDGREENEEGSQTIIPEAVPSHDNIPSEVPQVQGVDDIDDDECDNLPQASETEGVGEKDDEHQTDTLIHQKHNYLSDLVEDSNEDDDDTNSYISKEQEDVSECVRNDELERIHYVTKSGRSVKMRKDLFENYDFLQEDAGSDSNSDKVKSLSTQWSLKQGLRFFPEETKKQQ